MPPCVIYQSFSAFFRHGDIVYIHYVEPQAPQQQDQAVNDTAASSDDIKQDQVDDFLEKQRGLIDRKKDPKL